MSRGILKLFPRMIALLKVLAYTYASSLPKEKTIPQRWAEKTMFADFRTHKYSVGKVASMQW